jgi:hypothetical protein
MGTKAAWTLERRAKQAAIIAQTRPWERATGPRSDRGKAISSRNACTGAGEVAANYRLARDQVRTLALQRAEHLLKRLQQVRAQTSNVPLDDECAGQPACTCYRLGSG